MNDARRRRIALQERIKKLKQTFEKTMLDLIDRFEDIKEQQTMCFAHILFKDHNSAFAKVPNVRRQSSLMDMQKNGFWLKGADYTMWVPPGQIAHIEFYKDWN